MPSDIIAYRTPSTGNLPTVPVVSERVGRLLAPARTVGRYNEEGDFLGVHEEWLLREMQLEDVPDLRRQLALVEQAFAPANRGALLARVLALLAHYRDPNPLPPAVEQAVAEDWADDLGEYPAWAVEEACRRWRRDPKKYRYKPLPGDIRRLCEEVVAKEAAMADRLRRLLAATEAGKSAHEGGGAADVRSRVAALAAAKRLP
jgi:hypothetical protein